MLAILGIQVREGKTLGTWGEPPPGGRKNHWNSSGEAGNDRRRRPETHKGGGV